MQRAVMFAILAVLAVLATLTLGPLLANGVERVVRQVSLSLEGK